MPRRCWRSKSGDRRRRRSRSRSKSGDRRRRRSRSRSKSGDRRRRRSRSRSKSGDRRRRRSRSRSKSRDRRRRRSRSRSKSRDRRRQDVKQQSGADAPVVAAPKQQQQERVDLESTEGGVLEVVREGNSLGHLVIELQRLSKGCVFGRLPSCDVPLEHLSISRVHAQLTTDAAGGLFVTDMGSAHGTNVDGTWIKAKVPKQLRVGNVFKLGASARQYKVVKLPQRTARQ